MRPKRYIMKIRLMENLTVYIWHHRCYYFVVKIRSNLKNFDSPRILEWLTNRNGGSTKNIHSQCRFRTTIHNPSRLKNNSWQLDSTYRLNVCRVSVNLTRWIPRGQSTNSQFAGNRVHTKHQDHMLPASVIQCTVILLAK